MKRTALVAAVVAVVVGFGMDVGARAPLGAWSIVALGRLPGASFSEALAINGRGDIAGWSGWEEGRANAVLWRDGEIVDLGTLGGPMARAWGINDRGQVVGEAQTADGEFHAFLWEDGVMRALTSEPFNRAFAINRRGEVVGHYQFQQFLWRDDVLTPLELSSALDINNRGKIAGSVFVDGHNRPAIASEGTVAPLGLPRGATDAAARAISDRGVVAGEALIDGSVRGFRWINGRFDLMPPMIEGPTASFALAVNGHGMIVGEAFTNADVIGGARHGVVWWGDEMVDLGALPGGDVSSARAINDHGAIAGFSLNAAGEGEAVAWLPQKAALPR
jgi:probable HAF family extracellular repeat protein